MAARRAATVAAATALVAGGSAGLLAPPLAASTTGVTSIAVVITDNNLYVSGPTTFPAGRVKFAFEDARSKNRDATFAVIRLHPGYHWSDFRSDLKTVFANLEGPNGNKKKGLKALNHAIDNATICGGMGAHAGQVKHGALLLQQGSGRYYVFDDTGLPKHPQRIRVLAPVGVQTLPKAGGTVIAKTNRRFAGDNTLPADGRIRFENHSTESPHFLVLQHVKEGTTRKQVIEALQGNGPPDFILKGDTETDALSLGQAMVFHVHLPPGEYVEMCFFPDPKEGIPHALMGMVRVVHLK